MTGPEHASPSLNSVARQSPAPALTTSPGASPVAWGPGDGVADLNTEAWKAFPDDYRIPPEPPSLEMARDYCRRLATTHYENFSVATWFLPRHLRPHFYSVYAYCRIADDLGDEAANPQQALSLLNLWEEELNSCYEGTARHPVFVALRETITACDIPREPFADLLKAFRSDQSVTRYETFEALLGYCRYSANPVGRLVLYICGYRDAERQQLSDYTCTALQLANFWQDVARDYGKGRIYLPLESLARFGVTEESIARRSFSPAFRDLMHFEVKRARDWFKRGAPLATKVSRELAIDIELFTRGGEEILNAIERQGYDVLTRRPVISQPRKAWLLMKAAKKKLL